MRYIPIIILLLWVGLLSSLSLEYPSGNIYEIAYGDYAQTQLQSVSTKRSSPGGMEIETWQCLSLKLLLEEAGETDWDIARIVSKDNYETTVNRMALQAETAYLALFRNGERLSDYDVRLIFPDSHESTWIRDLKSISMEPLNTLPPLQIRALDTIGDFRDEASPKVDLHQSTLVSRGLRLANAEIVYLTMDYHKFSFKYPPQKKQINAMMNMRCEKGEYYLSWPGMNEEDAEAGKIIYLQCGNLGFVANEELELLPEIAISLGWDWGEMDKQLVEKKILMDISAAAILPKLDGNKWIEIK